MFALSVLRPVTNALLLFLFFTFILGFFIYYNYAHGQNTLSVFTDKSTYNVGDIVTVFGTVPTVTANVPLTIQLLDPVNATYTIGEPIPVNGKYSVEFELIYELAVEGGWTVKATYGDREAFSSFKVVAADSGIIKTGYPFTVRTDKDSYIGNETITVSGTVPFIDKRLFVEVSVFDPTDKVYTTTELMPATNGTYSFAFNIEPTLAIDGLYTVQAIYGEQRAQTTFKFAARIPEPRPPAEIKIDSVTPNEPRWGLDTINVRGSVINAAEGDTVTVEWGDGTSTPGIRISDTPGVLVSGVWSSESHIYNDTRVGENQIVAKLVERTSIGVEYTLAESDPYTIDVVKHSASLTLDPIKQLADNPFTVSGRLYDADTDKGLAGKNIIFKVSTVDGEISTEALSTDADGYYLSSRNLSEDLVASELLCQTHFAGDDLYLASSSDVHACVVAKEFSWWLVPAILAIAAATIITLKNVHKPSRKPNIRKEASTVITVEFEADIKR